MPIRIGCTGWDYQDWRGPFYPPQTPHHEFLERYSQVFGFTEVDSSFYGPPSAETTAKWAASTPPGFLFSLKIPGAISHEKRLRDAETELDDFLRGIAPLREANKLGPLVLQLAPSFTAPHDRPPLRQFLRRWPPNLRLAVELRDGSWWTEETFGWLREAGAGLVWSVTPFADVPAVRTTDFVYLRFVGDRQLTRFDHVQRDLTPLIEKWTPHVPSRDEQREAYIVVNNHFMGFAPGTARIASRIFGAPEPDLERATRRRHQSGLARFEA